MNQIIKAMAVTLIISVVAVDIFIRVTDKLNNTSIKSDQSLDEQVIKSEEMTRIDGTIYWDIVFKIPAKCDDMMDALSLYELKVEGKIFTPTCLQVGPNHIRIFYRSKNKMA